MRFYIGWEMTGVDTDFVHHARMLSQSTTPNPRWPGVCVAENPAIAKVCPPFLKCLHCFPFQ